MARKIMVEIVGDARSLEKAFNKSSRSAKRFQGDMDKTGRSGRRAFGGVGRMAGFAAGAIGTAGLVGAARAAFGEFSEAQKASAQTAAALKSTGGAANVTAKHIDELAESTLQLTGIDDEAVKTAENMLLTFTKVRNETGKGNKIFDRATRTVADLATAFNQGAVPSAEQMQTASVLLGKALNDPIKGVTALTRRGIQFTEQQKDQIKALVKSGQTMEAQKLILRELNTQVGGRAAAAGKTFAGQWSKIRNTLLNLSAVLVAKLMPTIERLLGQLARWLSNSRNQKQVLDTVNAAIGAVSVAARVLTTVFKGLNAITGSTKNTFLVLLGAFAFFKSMKLVAYIAGMTKAMRGFAVASAAASAAGMGGGGVAGTAGKVGRFGRVLGAVGSVAVGAPLVASAIRQIPGWDKTFRGIGGAVADRTVAVTVGVDRSANLVPRVEQNLTKRSRGRPRRRRGAR